jgi:hypothetical protein
MQAAIIGALTRVQIHLPLAHPLDATLWERLRDAHAIYGIERIVVNAEQTSLMVDYDATRLRPLEVRVALKRCGIPV